MLPAEPADLLHDRLVTAQQLDAAREHRLAGRRQLQLRGAPGQQVHPKPTLELADAAAERRLADAQPLCRTSEMPFLRERDKALEQPQLGD